MAVNDAQSVNITYNQHSIKIGELVKGITSSPIFCELSNKEARGLALHHSQLKPDWVFVAVKGTKGHGLDFLAQARAAGALAILVDTQDYIIEHHKDIIPINNLLDNLNLLADRIFGEDTLEWLGITGTNGKSSVAHILAYSLQHLGCPTAVIGTVYNGLAGEDAYIQSKDFLSPTMTTPDILTLRRLGSEFQAKGVICVAIECSSHALHQFRVDSLNIRHTVFTNISEEHRDYHGSMSAYIAAKRRLFDLPKVKYATLNFNDSLGKKWHNELKDKLSCITYGINNSHADICATNIEIAIDCSNSYIKTKQEQGILQTQVSGSWGIENCMAALGVILQKGYKLSDALKALSYVPPLAGRMQKLQSAVGTIFIVDYAHTPDALEKILGELRDICDKRDKSNKRDQGKLWVVFGCGGNRDNSKRANMGQIAAKYADKLVITSDNPRYEDPAQIIADILAGINEDSDIIVESDRSKALELVLESAGTSDLVVVAGKGHESYQEIGGEKYFFNDYSYLRERISRVCH